MLRPSSLILPPLGFLYGAAMQTRLALYRRGLLTIHQLDAPVISVGNITVGGTGKTPLVEWLARKLASEGRRVCILTRGYGRAGASRRVVVSDGKTVLANAREGGDEPRMLAEMLLDSSVAVVSDANRVAAARWSSTNLGSDAFILDDGFQHLRIVRNLDIVTLDATNPWGGAHLLPHGRLRESLEQLARADLIIITRADLAHDIDALRGEAQRLSDGRAAILTSRLKTLRLRRLDSQTTRRNEQSQLNEQESATNAQESPTTIFMAFCAVGNPGGFFAHLRRDGYVLSHTRSFSDHHAYRQVDVDALAREAAAHEAQAFLTTAKDAVKLGSLSFALPCYVVDVGLVFDDEEMLLAHVRRAIAR
ncbi:MAG TPA: tetraacyldisaccharide 4'-kinase [Pyrinomonadaceae bacterium]|jgi:tetraacyldisaccharide 4'-kinase